MKFLNNTHYVGLLDYVIISSVMATTPVGVANFYGRDELMASGESQTWSEPHRTQLPSWSRPALCGRGVRTLLRDRLAFQRPAQDPDVSPKAAQLERHLSFLKQQHLETLQQLHKEVEGLKKENRELNFKLIMCRCGQRKLGRRRAMHSIASGEETDPGTPNDELRTIFLEEEVRELRNALATERSKNGRLMRVIEQKVVDQKSDQLDGESGVSQPAVQPGSLQECKTIIRSLQHRNDQQNHELLQIKADLRDVLYSHKWTPDAYLLARAYVPHQEEGGGGLPRVDIQKNKDTVDRAYQRVKEGVVLPALRPKVPATVAERQRKSQAVRGRHWTSLQ